MKRKPNLGIHVALTLFVIGVGLVLTYFLGGGLRWGVLIPVATIVGVSCLSWFNWQARWNGEQPTNQTD